MKKTCVAGLIGLALCAGSAMHSVYAADAKHPNLVIILADDLGYGDLGAYGHQIVKTPNIDKLAQEGVKFTDYYAPAPLCSPSRAGLLTGRMPFRTGIRSWIPEGKNVALGRNELTIANLLKQQGYDTAIMGKLHLNAGGDRTDQPQAKDMGFDYRLVNTAGFVSDSTLDNAKERPRYGMVYPTGFTRNEKPIGRAKTFSGELVSSEVVNWLDKKKDNNPFFLYVAFTEVHSPLASPKKYLDMYAPYISAYARQHPDLFYGDWADKPWRGAGEYYANISYMDAQVGKVLDKIKAMGEEDNTIVIFTSDNGPVTREARKVYELNLAGETDGLRGRKDNLWEGGIRVPAIIKYGHHIPQGMVSETPMSGLDWMPTLAQMMNFPLPKDRTYDGQSIVPVLEKQAFKREKPLIFGIDMPFQDDPTDEWAIRDGDWKMIIDREGKAKYLYNLKQDRAETLNQIGKQPEIEQRMFAEFLKYKNDIDNDSLMKARGDKPTPVTWG
ncbi:TPA: sulfatase-like hydrolase/transferase [Klebsiella oxytoca]|uniref:sulfatase family protein n=1 Tax=Klebsiella oxytoca TaxID=571 RepID=UPI0011587283|nr:sulfatase-like hydrolase/transferase [Klebsiella oxytoca]MDG9997616.1 sulfatase-like hydrolase/transferase [Klebsiella oxytoca]MDU4361687.1 sulfatase-like hydrolase/transferase [Klebsiella oxytoca]HBC7361220.1 sulfatase-like hydrolase/transferase [Klebsiella oxytoca]HBM3042338.1 sulfatase-like hydrolase/transferase [Klebsiella oxytoca]HBN2791602.1 sulfatase-like hydrolase/transferase [Klebsiella oxytoca]